MHTYTYFKLITFSIPAYLNFFFIPKLGRRGRYTALALSFLLSLTNIFHHTFLSNHASQPFQTWYGASARGLTSCLPNSGLPVVYFLFPGSVHFWTLHLADRGGILSE